jgi:lipopolysaccharide biosynthesis glycosyltransferase
MKSGALQPVTVVTLADEQYAVPLAAMGRSLCENMRPGGSAVLFIIDGGLTPATKQHLLDSWDLQKLKVRFVAPQFGQDVELPVWGRLPPLTYVRIFVPLILPEITGKVIFLDSDVLVLKDIEELWKVDLDGYSLLAVQDPAVPYVSSRSGLKQYRDLNIPPAHPYLNAGLMVIDVDKWAATNTTEKVMAFIRQNANELSYCDQDGLNAVLWQDWKALDARWQVQPRFVLRDRLPLPHLDAITRSLIKSDPWVLHFSGRVKPWMYYGPTRPDRIFYDYIDRTHWKGWRPAFTLSGWIYWMYDSWLRDWVYPVEQWGHRMMRNLSRRTVRVESSDS